MDQLRYEQMMRRSERRRLRDLRRQARKLRAEAAAKAAAQDGKPVPAPTAAPGTQAIPVAPAAKPIEPTEVRPPEAHPRRRRRRGRQCGGCGRRAAEFRNSVANASGTTPSRPTIEELQKALLNAPKPPMVLPKK